MFSLTGKGLAGFQAEPLRAAQREPWVTLFCITEPNSWTGPLLPPQRWLGSPRKMGEGLYQPLAEINVTSLVDLLLLIVMVTAPMSTTGIKVNLPAAKTPELLEAEASHDDPPWGNLPYVMI